MLLIIVALTLAVLFQFALVAMVLYGVAKFTSFPEHSRRKAVMASLYINLGTIVLMVLSLLLTDSIPMFLSFLVGSVLSFILQILIIMKVYKESLKRSLVGAIAASAVLFLVGEGYKAFLGTLSFGP